MCRLCHVADQRIERLVLHINLEKIVTALREIVPDLS